METYLGDIRNGRLPLAAAERLTREQMIMEAIYLGFRTTAGIELSDFRRRFGIDFEKMYQATISDLKHEGL